MTKVNVIYTGGNGDKILSRHLGVRVREGAPATLANYAAANRDWLSTYVKVDGDYYLSHDYFIKGGETLEFYQR